MGRPTRAVQVHLEIAGETVAVGTAYVDERRRTTSMSFTYDSAFVGEGAGLRGESRAAAVRPDHQVSGMPGAFRD